MVTAPASEDPTIGLLAEVAALRGEVGDLKAWKAQAEARFAALEPPAFTDRERDTFARIVESIALGEEFEAGDISADQAEAQHIGAVLAKVERTSGGLLGLRVTSRMLHGRRRYRLRLAPGVDLGGPGSAPQDDDPGA
jgi:hypothetical protein